MRERVSEREVEKVRGRAKEAPLQTDLVGVSDGEEGKRGTSQQLPAEQKLGLEELHGEHALHDVGIAHSAARGAKEIE